MLKTIGDMTDRLKGGTMSKRIYFVRTVEGGIPAMLELHKQMHPNGRRVLNSTEWRGYAPRTCGITRLWGGQNQTSPTLTVNIEVTRREKGDISYTGQTRYDGWTAMMPDRNRDGTLLDGAGQPLPDGQPKVFLPYEVYNDIDFNELEFGEFVKEIDEPSVKHLSKDEVFAEAEKSGAGIVVGQGSFVVAHRSRPETKLVLSNDPSGEGTDGRGTKIVLINLSTPHLEQVLMDRVTALICDFLEGKAAIGSVDFADASFVQLSRVVMDCEPNELDQPTWFNMLTAYTPITFLEDLAKRLMAQYCIDVSVVDGKDGGLLLRHENSAK